MARRRRRGRFNRISPDMGWWVDTGDLSFIRANPNGDNGVFGTAVSILQFGDITDDDSLITRDNSDWFIKRVLLEVFPAYSANNGGEQPTDAARLWTCAIGTIDNDKLAEWVVNQSHRLFEPDGYEMWARVFRQYNKPVYATHTPKIVTGSAFTGAEAVNTSSTENYVYRVQTEPWGPSAIVDDFTVSNAGLRPEQSVSLAIGDLSGPTVGYSWDPGDQLLIRWCTRILLQKRRAS